MLLSVPLALKGSQCKLIQDTVFDTLLGDQPTYVASFGNSDVNSVGDWVKILNTRPANEVKLIVTCNCFTVLGLYNFIRVFRVLSRVFEE